MSWNGNGGKGGGPWGSGGGGGPWGQRRPPGGGGGQPPDLDEFIRRTQQSFKGKLPPGSSGLRVAILVILGVVVLFSLQSMFYRVDTDERGVVLRFGEYHRTTAAGLHFKLPAPIEMVQTPKVTRENRIEIGFREIGGRIQDFRNESLMLTGDENMIDIDFTVTWNIKDPEDYLFNLKDPDGTARVAAESVMREIVGQTDLQTALTVGRAVIQTTVEDNLQRLLDDYGAGINVVRVQLLKVDPPSPVIDAFNDVQRARQDEERAKNEATAYRNQILQQARGEAARKIQEAEGFRQEIVNRAKGDAERFRQVAEAYSKAPEVTARRMYLEAMEEVFSNSGKVLLDVEGGGVMPFLPLQDFVRERGRNGQGGQR